MKIRKYYRLYSASILIIFLFIGFITLLYTYFEVENTLEWQESWPFIALLIAGFYLVVPLTVGMVIFPRLKKAIKNKEENKIRGWVNNFSFKVTLPMVLSSLTWYCTMVLPDYFYFETGFVDSMNILLTMGYISFVFPGFLCYMLSTFIQSKIKVDLYFAQGIQFLPRKARIGSNLVLLIFISSIYPLAILVFNVLSYFDPDMDRANLIFIAIDMFLFLICIGTGLFVITKSLTSPINTLLTSFARMQQGDFSSRVPVSTKGELGKLTHHYNVMAFELEKRERIKETFGQYVSPVIAEQILDRESVLSGEERIVTIMFTDIQGYTSITEGLTPSETIDLMNQYYERLIPIVNKYQGTVNKFIGDALMVLFNAPNDDEDHAFHCVQCGREIVEVTQQELFLKDIPLKTRVGINTGPAIAGRLGGQGRYEYTLLGDSVNLAQRLESLNKQTGTYLLMNETTAREVHPRLALKPMGSTKVKGKNQPAKVFALK